MSPPPHATPGVPVLERILAGFCHDLNGRLAAAEGFLHLLAPGYDPTGPASRLRDLLMDMADMTARLRDLARDEDAEPTATSLAGVVEAAGAILRWHPEGGSVEIDGSACAEAPAVVTDHASAVRTVLLALTPVLTTPAGNGRLQLAVRVSDDGVELGIPVGGHLPADPSLVEEASGAGVQVGSDGEVRLLRFRRLGAPGGSSGG